MVITKIIQDESILNYFSLDHCLVRFGPNKTKFKLNKFENRLIQI